MPLSLYLDDCADDDTLAALLRRAGHQVHTPRVAGTSGVSDGEHLDYEVSKNMSRAQIVVAIGNLVASGIPIANEISILNYWR